MVRFIGAVVVALTMSAVALSGQTPGVQRPTERISPEAQVAAKNLMQDVKTVGCIRLWTPAPDDPTKAPRDRQPGLAGIYLLTPLSSNATTDTDNPTYLLTPSATLNFWQHVGHKVEVVGTAQAAPLPPTVQDLANVPRPEEKASTNGMPRLTLSSMKLVTENCP